MENPTAPGASLPRSLFERNATALLFLGFLVLIVVEPIVLRGHVATPLDNHQHFRSGIGQSTYPQFPYLSDINRYFIPKLQLQFQGDHAGWNATWDPYVQLGKPASHFGGYSKAYPITYALSFFTRNPYRLHAWLSVCTLGLLAFFAFFFLRSLNLHPAAALIGAVGIGLNTRSIYWFGFAQLLAWAAWSLGILWLSVRLLQKFHLGRWVGLAFCCFCLIIGGRHQATIGMAYLLVPFLFLLLLQSNHEWREKGRLALVLGGAVFCGVALSFPLAYDLLKGGWGSVRFHADTTNFVLEHQGEFWRHDLAMLWNVFAFGNPSRSTYPLHTSALSFTPFFFSLFAIAFVTDVARRAWLFLVVAFFFLAMAASQAVHLFAIQFLGFGFSRTNPLGGIYIPGLIVCAYTVDRLLTDRSRNEITPRWPLLATGIATVLGVIAVVAPHPIEQIHWGYFFLGLGMTAAAIAFVYWRSPLILYGVALYQVGIFTAPTLLHRPFDEVAHSSPLVEFVKEHVHDGHRFAKFGRMANFLPSNEEVLVSLPSIHSYDSLSSVHYNRLMSTLSDKGVRTYGRHFDQLDNHHKLQSAAMSYTGVSAILSDRPLPLRSWNVLKAPTNALLYTAPSSSPLIAQIADFSAAEEGGITLSGPLTAHAKDGWTEVLERRDNFQRIKTTPVSSPSLLFVSCQFHADWIARAARHRLTTVRINDFYLGVLLPPGTKSVDLEFAPLARWAWTPLVFFAVVFPAALYYSCRRPRIA